MTDILIKREEMQRWGGRDGHVALPLQGSLSPPANLRQEMALGVLTSEKVDLKWRFSRSIFDNSYFKTIVSQGVVKLKSF